MMYNTAGVTPWPDQLDYHAGLITTGNSAMGEHSFGLYPVEEDEEQSVISPWEILTAPVLDPLVTMIFGRRGHGKTLTMTAIASILQQSYIHTGIKATRENPDGYKIFANYHIDFADFFNPLLVDMLVEFPPWAKNGCCFIDEILAYFPSRRAMARENLNFATFMQQIRKRDMEMVFTTQFPQDLDNQMIRQIDLFMMPIMLNRGKTVQLLIWDWWGQYTGRMWWKKFPPIDEPPDFNKKFHFIDEVYGHYPTKEVVAPKWSASREDIIDQHWGDDIRFIQDRVAQQQKEFEDAKATAQESRKAKTLVDLVDNAPEEVYVLTLFDDAKELDPALKTTKQLAEIMQKRGYDVFRDGSKGFLAVRKHE